jgi:arylsulfatase A-like enzyme
MVESQAKHAFELDKETPELRDRYGRTRFGQGCLLARRLVERGVPFVEVTLSGTQTNPVSWDTHANNFVAVRELCEILDPAWSTLMDDLRERGMLDSTLIVWMGEFGRTPQINPNMGRDHFPTAWSTVLGGAGVRGGQVIGDTGKDGLAVIDRPVSVPEFVATICTALGIDYEKDNYTREDRPIALVDEGGAPIKELVG